ncbi:MAG TPA: hypothetical protein VJ770_01460, partial [Stellaceae bacterium]|nr:hypothetical protein [Stellaceae bacterium]
MRRKTRIAVRAVGVAILAPVLAVAVLWAGINTAPGRRLIERLAPRLTGGEVRIAGLGGRLPADIRAARVEIRDANGTWMRIDDLTIAWSPLRLLQGALKVETLAAVHASVLRVPETSGGSFPPLRLLVERLRVDRLTLAPAVAGNPVALSLSGTLRFASLREAEIALAAGRLGGPGRYDLHGRVDAAGIRARIAAAEPARGPLAAMMRLPDLGPLSITASLVGPRAAERVTLAVAAGPLRAAGDGVIDLQRRSARIDLSASAPAMTPRPDFSWRSAKLAAHVRGPFARPKATGHLEIEGIAAGSGRIERLTADIRGDGGALGLTAAVGGLRLPVPQPALLAAAPLEFRIDARLDGPPRPVTFSLSHPLFSIAGHADAVGGKVAGALELTVPALAPWAAAEGLDVQGQARLKADFSVAGKSARLASGGSLSVTGGLPAAVRLLGNNVGLNFAVALDGRDVTVERVGIAATAFKAAASGSNTGGVLAFSWEFGIPDLSRLDPKLAGALAAKGRLAGPEERLGLTAEASGVLAGAGLPRVPFSLSLDAQDLPGAPTARVTGQGRLAGAPLQFAASGTRGGDGAWQMSITRARWKSAEGDGVLTWAPGAAAPLGHVRLRMARLDQLQPVLGTAPSGSLDARIDLRPASGRNQAALRVEARQLALGGRAV